ncbi:MAG: LysM peptidoglycan-binding domain-containing protein [Bacteroidales bacterium]|nr:LysM peptidoglycan-binding domain-containing protein [Bacteroidales bacterium]MCB8999708.1 LysM peptidoglycan-binding domain-containing protein [Bacteroidales bacterium]
MSSGKYIFYLLLLIGFSIQRLQADDRDTIRIDDSLVHSGFEDNLDSLLNLYYVQQVIQIEDADSLMYMDGDSLLPSYPDSVYIERLGKLPTVVELSYNRVVKNFIDLYTEKRRDRVEIMLRLSDYYFPMFEEIFDRYGIPEELKYLSIIESALNPRAVSRAGATGMWQFMYYTGKTYGLTINSLVDERRDPQASTIAAAKFLKDLYGIYNDWTLVIAAYNCGPGNVNKAIRRSGGKRNYWDIYYYLPRETRGYVPAFIAATYVMNYSREHRLYPADVDFDFLTDTIMVREKLHLKQVSEVMGIPIAQLRDLNPQYKYDIIPGDSKPLALRIPQMQSMRFIELEDSIYAYKDSVFFNQDNIIISPTAKTTYIADLPADKYTKLIYTVKSGDNLGFISTWYNVRLSDLRYWNNIRQNVIRSGQQLVIYVPKSSAEKYRNIDNMSFTEKQAMSGKTVSTTNTVQSSYSPPSGNAGDYIYYTVRSGDTLWEIAKNFPGVSDTDIANLNNLRDGDSIKPGQVIKIKKKS